MNARIRRHCACRLIGSAVLGLLFAFLCAGSTAHRDLPEQAGSAPWAGLVTFPGDPPAGGAPPVQARRLAIDQRPPMSFQQWRAAQPPPAPLRVERVYASPTLSAVTEIAPVVCALVHPSLYQDIALSLDRWAADVEQEGWDVVIESASFPDPPAMRAHLASIPNLQGCLLVGDFPIPWYRWVSPSPPYTAHDFPLDLYYMDLDGVWRDDDEDGLYEDHTGDTGLEIWIGRLTAGPLTFGRDEAALVNGYFDKNHAYRSGDLALPARALGYVDDPWTGGGAAGLRQTLSLLYPDTTVLTDFETTRPEDYARRLTDNYAWIHLIAHSTASSHIFLFSQENPPYGHTLYNETIYDIDPHALFYNFFACGVGRFTERDYIVGWYIFADTYGLAAWGSTSSGGMARDWQYLYGRLAQGQPLGAAFLGWYAQTTANKDDRGFHYGLTTFGDPTLTVDAADPPGQPPAALTLSGPASAGLGLAYPFTATVEPPTSTQPLRYTWQVTDQVILSRNGGLQDERSLAWTTTGLKTLVVTATNYAGSVTRALTLTVQAPDGTLAPRALSETLVLGAALTRSLTMSNGGPVSAAGPGELGYRLIETERAVGAGAGPDPFGYTHLDSNQPGGPSYRWIEIAPPAGGSGTELTTLTGAGSAYMQSVALPFAFPYYGRQVDALTVHVDGLLSLGDRPVDTTNLPLPSARGYETERLIAPYWDDLAIYPGAVYVQDVGSAFVVEYYNVSRPGDTSDPGSWQVLLYDNGSLLFQYQDVDLWGSTADSGKTATVGIQGDALSGLQYSYNEPALSAGLALCFAYPGQLPDCSTPVDASWLSVHPAEGVVPAAGQHALDLVFDTRTPQVTGPGLYRMTLVALTNDPEESVVSVPVAMTVLTPTYGLALTPLVDARSGPPGTVVTYSLHVTNTGNAPDVFDLSISDATWPTVAPAAVGPLNSGSGASLNVTVAIPPEAVHNATDAALLTLVSRGASSARAAATLTTTAHIAEPPRYDLFFPLVVRPSR